MKYYFNEASEEELLNGQAANVEPHQTDYRLGMSGGIKCLSSTN